MGRSQNKARIEVVVDPKIKGYLASFDPMGKENLTRAFVYLVTEEAIRRGLLARKEKSAREYLTEKQKRFLEVLLTVERYEFKSLELMSYAKKAGYRSIDSRKGAIEALKAHGYLVPLKGTRYGFNINPKPFSGVAREAREKLLKQATINGRGGH